MNDYIHLTRGKKLTCQNKGPDAAEEARKESIEWERSNRKRVHKLNKSGAQGTCTI